MTAAILMGAGGFNFYDGIIQHAILHLHLVNEYVCNLAITHGNDSLGNCPQDIPYEIVWDILGFAFTGSRLFTLATQQPCVAECFRTLRALLKGKQE